MSIDLYDAHLQWAYRLPDERYASLNELLSYTTQRKNNSSEFCTSLDRVNPNVTPEGGISINHNGNSSLLSNWAFGQMCVVAGAPAKYLRTLPSPLVRDCLQYNLKTINQECKLLVREEYPETNGNPYIWTSALTSPKYGRIWDADVVENLMKAIEDNNWQVPKSQKKEPSGLYASDRDMFVFMVNEDNPVTIGNAKLGKGFFCWNSETGAQTFGFTTFLYNYVCDNHIVWGAEQIKELKIIHRSQALNRFYLDAMPIINNFVEYNVFSENIKSTVDKAMNTKIGNNLEEILDWFKYKPFTNKEIVTGYETGISEGEDANQLWGMVQGLTAYARDMPFTDKRINLERRAGTLLSI